MVVLTPALMVWWSLPLTLTPALSVWSPRTVGSRWALETAKANLVRQYLLVGLTEELEDFVMILEAVLPRFFRGATQLYRTGTRTHSKH